MQFVDVGRPRQVTVGGRKASFDYDAATHTLTVPVDAVAARRGAVVRHDGRILTEQPAPVVGFALDAPQNLVAGVPSQVVATVTNNGPGTIGHVSVALPQPSGWTVTPTSPTDTGTLAAGGSFKATYKVTTPTSAKNNAMTGTVGYRDPDGGAVTLPQSLTVQPRPVAVTFRVRVPADTPADADIYLPGSIDQLGPWDPGKLKLTDEGGGIWQTTVSILDGTDVSYKYTRGDWNRVEWWGGITGTNNRDVTIDGDANGTMLVDDTSTAWDDPSVPDAHKAVEYWRDPLVASTTPADGSTVGAPAAVTVGFARDVAPAAGSGFDQAVAVTTGGTTVSGTVAETSPGVLTWTPSAPLGAGTYQVTVSGVQSALGTDGVPMNEPDTFTFTVAGG